MLAALRSLRSLALADNGLGGRGSAELLQQLTVLTELEELTCAKTS
jgi:hypothetical protein